MKSRLSQMQEQELWEVVMMAIELAVGESAEQVGLVGTLPPSLKGLLMR